LSFPIASRPRAALNLAAAAVATALLGGCSYSIQKVDNPVAMPSAWDATIAPTATDTLQQEWWRAFNSPVLNELIERGLRDSPTLIQAEERLKQAERNFARSRDDLFPELSLSARTSRTETGGNQTPERTSDSTSVGLSTSYTVDLFGAQAARYRAQVAGFIGSKYDTDLARITLAANISRAYFNLLSIRSQVSVARENLRIAEDLLRIFEVRWREGVSREFDFTQQTTQVLQQRTQLIPLENQMRQAETTLGLLLGVTPQDFHLEGEPIDQLTVPEIAPWVPAELLSRRPDMAGAELDMIAQRANLAAARASLIPVTLTLNASGNTASQELFQLTDARTFSVGAALSIAEGIFNFRQRRTNILNAESNEYIALITYAQTIRQALKEVDDTLATAVANQRSEETTRQTLANAQRSLQLAQVEYREGSANLQEVLDAQRSLFSAQDTLARSRLTRLNTAVNLYVALGGGWAGPNDSRAPD
jgi:NodT family efflux transporter outer membrane factor (OMF) lipoprotein